MDVNRNIRRGRLPEHSPRDRASLAHTVTPRPVRWLARFVFLMFLSIPFALALVPWQQTVICRGTIVAYSPVERMQVLTARVSGQVDKWHVVEGSRVKMNDPLVDIEDNDPELAARLEAQRDFLRDRLEASRQEVDEQQASVEQPCTRAISRRHRRPEDLV